ncbi:virulence factor mvin family protein [Mycobacterium ulcerans str. Harvey]|uniref:Virulence factor mvin family protein n=1 Tax=Mycobacterium ulcerans str. Harvey TaxID=1299332 RepID=A0ABP3AID1_MYCUL|nr:virulence factor mvin family protein [Mycobacterium ulcerans str. Harvey]
MKAQQATVFSPGGTPDHPGQAGLAIDGDPNSAWPTDTYVDATPFPAFKQGVGLILRLAKPTVLSEVTIDVPSTGTEVQIRAAGSATPASLSDTTALTPNVALHPGTTASGWTARRKRPMCWCGSASWAQPRGRAVTRSPTSRCAHANPALSPMADPPWLSRR